mgnify:CR=1 FL=1
MNTAIIHLSDLHLTELKNAEGEYIYESWFLDKNNRFEEETLDFIKNKKEKLNIDNFILVVSGDLSNTSSQEEYDVLASFLEKLIAKTNIHKNNVLIVPGNHDINWAENMKAYEESKNTSLKKKTAHEFYEEKYKYFSKFYNDFYSNDIKFPSQKYVIRDFSYDNSILFVCLNSTLEMSYVKEQENQRRVIFDLSKLEKELEELSKQYDKKYSQLIKIAILHHNPIKMSTDPTSKCIHNWDNISNIFKKYDIKIFLFGHEHVANMKREDDFLYISVGGLGNKNWGENSISFLRFDLY